MSSTLFRRLPRLLLALFAAAGAVASSMSAAALGTVFVAAVAAGYSAPAQAWWACPTGYPAQFQTRNGDTNVRCMDEENYTCPKVVLPGTNVQVGTNRVERTGLDVCRALQSTIDFPYVCPVGYSQVSQDGRDICRAYSAPTRNVP